MSFMSITGLNCKRFDRPHIWKWASNHLCAEVIWAEKYSCSHKKMYILLVEKNNHVTTEVWKCCDTFRRRRRPSFELRRLSWGFIVVGGENYKCAGKGFSKNCSRKHIFKRKRRTDNHLTLCCVEARARWRSFFRSHTRTERAVTLMLAFRSKHLCLQKLFPHKAQTHTFK